MSRKAKVWTSWLAMGGAAVTGEPAVHLRFFEYSLEIWAAGAAANLPHKVRCAGAGFIADNGAPVAPPQSVTIQHLL